MVGVDVVHADHRIIVSRQGLDRRADGLLDLLVLQPAVVGHGHVEDKIGVLGPGSHAEVVDGHIRIDSPDQLGHLSL